MDLRQRRDVARVKKDVIARRTHRTVAACPPRSRLPKERREVQEFLGRA